MLGSIACPAVKLNDAKRCLVRVRHFGACMAEIEGNDVSLLTNELHARESMEEAVRRHR